MPNKLYAEEIAFAMEAKSRKLAAVALEVNLRHLYTAIQRARTEGFAAYPPRPPPVTTYIKDAR